MTPLPCSFVSRNGLSSNWSQDSLGSRPLGALVCIQRSDCYIESLLFSQHGPLHNPSTPLWQKDTCARLRTCKGKLHYFTLTIESYFIVLLPKPSSTIWETLAQTCCIHAPPDWCTWTPQFAPQAARAHSPTHTFRSANWCWHLQLWYWHIPGVLPTRQVERWQAHSSTPLACCQQTPPGLSFSLHVL